MTFHFRLDTMPCAKLETGNSIAVTSIEDHYFRGFSIPQLFRCEHSTFPVIISSPQFSSFEHEKQLQLS